MKILFLGDIVGPSGRKAISSNLSNIVRKKKIWLKLVVDNLTCSRINIVFTDNIRLPDWYDWTSSFHDNFWLLDNQINWMELEIKTKQYKISRYDENSSDVRPSVSKGSRRPSPGENRGPLRGGGQQPG